PGHELRYYEAQADGQEPAEVYTSDLVAISTFSAQVFEAYAVADRLRRAGVRVALGGLHVSVRPEEALEHADLVFVGEGENTWPAAVRALERGEPQRRIWNAADFEPVDVRSLPLPRYDLLGGREFNRFTVQTTRGCPWRCDFCASNVMLQQAYRKRPVADVVRDIEAIQRLRDAGIQSVSLSLDGSDAARHDAFRGVPGCFDLTLRAAGWVAEAGLPLQVNTLVTDRTAADLPAIYHLLATLPVERWSLFFLIAVGRGTALRELDPAAAERLMGWLYERAAGAPFAIKTTEAPHFRRVAVERMRAAGWDGARIRQSSVGRGFGIRDGNGILFISRTGDVTPSGFLPLAAGNVRRARLVDLYRSSALFLALRDPARFAGRCGRCEYRTICGGSRARAFAHTGDALASDPLCPYVPA
ncbi:MAG: cobalamin-dependent protein, partial [Candidatus Rokubacteria bacterium]|nr:cobalamin-dependent protein [Candidatus Rokubacteria bacterium]